MFQQRPVAFLDSLLRIITRIEFKLTALERRIERGLFRDGGRKAVFAILRIRSNRCCFFAKISEGGRPFTNYADFRVVGDEPNWLKFTPERPFQQSMILNFSSK